MTTYVYDGLNMVTDYNGLWTVRSKYVFGRGLDEPLSVDQGGSLYYYHTDGLGSVNELTDASGNTVKTYRYDSFGKISAQTGGLDQPFAFTGREYDLETGLYYYRARYYDPKVGRFISKDPIGFGGGDVNLFRYVGNDPGNWVDHLGFEKVFSGYSSQSKKYFFPQMYALIVDKPLAPYLISGGMITSGLAHILVGIEFPVLSPIMFPIGVGLAYTALDILLDQFPILGIDLIPGFSLLKHEKPEKCN